MSELALVWLDAYGVIGGDALSWSGSDLVGSSGWGYSTSWRSLYCGVPAVCVVERLNSVAGFSELPLNLCGVASLHIRRQMILGDSGHEGQQSSAVTFGLIMPTST